MTTYGTIPTSSGPGGPSGSTNPLDFIARAKERGYSALATRRPWRELGDPHAFGIPLSIGEAYLRIRTNAARFAMNYAIVVLVVVFLSLLWHPISLIVFVVSMIAWLFLYFLRDGEALILFGREISDPVVIGVLGVVTIGLLLLTNATVNILVSLLIGVIIVVLHAAFHKVEEEEEVGGGRWYPVPTSAAAAAASKV